MAERQAFAVDVIGFFLSRMCEPDVIREFTSSSAYRISASNRERLRVTFNENVENMLHFMDGSLSFVQEEFNVIALNNRLDSITFLRYCIASRETHVFNSARAILFYCARVAKMACNFLASNVPEVIDETIDIIMRELNDLCIYHLVNNMDVNISDSEGTDSGSDTASSRTHSTSSSDDNERKPVISLKE